MVSIALIDKTVKPIDYSTIPYCDLPNPGVTFNEVLYTSKGIAFIIPAKYKALIEKHSWYCNPADGYLRGDWRQKGTRKHYLLHRYVYELAYGEIKPRYSIDHVNGDKLNNSLSNLRMVTYSENTANTHKRRNGERISPYPCVAYRPNRNRVRPYQAEIEVNDKNKHLGMYATAEEAYKVYCEAFKDVYGHYPAHMEAYKGVTQC